MTSREALRQLLLEYGLDGVYADKRDIVRVLSGRVRYNTIERKLSRATSWVRLGAELFDLPATDKASTDDAWRRLYDLACEVYTIVVGAAIFKPSEGWNRSFAVEHELTRDSFVVGDLLGLLKGVRIARRIDCTALGELLNRPAQDILSLLTTVSERAHGQG